MPEGPTIVDTSCLIALESIDHLWILEQQYDQIVVPTAVATEWRSEVPQWIDVFAVQNQSLVQSLRDRLGAGESEAIACALESGAERLVLDDRRARRIAQQFDLPLTGTVGVILRAKQRGLLTAVGPLLDDISRAGFSLSDQLVIEARRLAGE